MSPERRAIMSGEDRVNRAKHALHIDVDDLVPLLGIAAGDVSVDIASRIGEQNVDRTEPIDCRCDHGCDVGRLRQIQGQGDGAPSRVRLPTLSLAPVSARPARA